MNIVIEWHPTPKDYAKALLTQNRLWRLSLFRELMETATPREIREITGEYMQEWVRIMREGEEEQLPYLIHPCCGCSCHVCSKGHSIGEHTEECMRTIAATDPQDWPITPIGETKT